MKKQINDFENHRKLLQLHGKFKNNKVWGGTIGSIGYRPSPNKLALKESLKLPPLSNKPVFSNEKFGKLTISEANMPKMTSTSNGRIHRGDLIQGYKSTEVKPHTASKTISHSMKTFETESKTPNPMRKT